MIKIHIFRFSRLRKLEFANFVRGIMTIVQKYDATALQIESMMSISLEKLSLVNKLEVTKGSHRFSKQINKLRRKRNNILSAILKQVASYKTAEMEYLQNEVNTVETFVTRMMKEIRQVNEKDRTERLVQLFILMDNDESLKKALSVLGFDTFINEARELHDEIERLFAVRVKETSELSRGETLAIKAEISETVTNLYRRIELAAIENPSVDYLPLINELNTWGIPFQAMIKGRDTRSENQTEIMESEHINKAAALSPTTTATA